MNLLGFSKKDVGRLTYRRFKNLYYHYQNYYDFTLRKLTYKEVEERIMEDEEWLK